MQNGSFTRRATSGGLPKIGPARRQILKNLDAILKSGAIDEADRRPVVSASASSAAIRAALSKPD